MINLEKPFNIHDYVEILLRRKWYILIPFVIVLTGTIPYALYSPKAYLSSTLILVTPQKVPEQIIRPTVTSRIEDRLQSIGQEIMSRTRLEQIIKEFKLYPEEAKRSTDEEIVDKMRKDIRVDIKREGYFFTISYSGKDPIVVTRIANKLASLFIEENLKYREQQAQGTTEFLGIELNGTKAKLEEQEKSIIQYKKQFMAELPEQRDANLKILEQLQRQMEKIGDNLRGARDRKLIIQKQLNDMKVMMASMPSIDDLVEEESPASPSSPASPLVANPFSASKPKSPVQVAAKPKTLSPYEVELNELKKQLALLQMKYTENHPDIRLTRKRIADLEEKVKKVQEQREKEEERERIELARREEEMAREQIEERTIAPLPIDSKSKSPKKERRREPKESIDANAFYKEMEGQLTATDLEIKRLEEEESKTRSMIHEYQARIENTPVRELALITLSRDYENTKDSYNTLLKKSQEAQQAENLERRQKGEQFKVIDPARVPEKPYKPNIPRIMLFGILLGMGCGFGMAFVREQMDRSFRDASDLEAALGLRVIANIPRIKLERAA